MINTLVGFLYDIFALFFFGSIFKAFYFSWWSAFSTFCRLDMSPYPTMLYKTMKPQRCVGDKNCFFKWLLSAGLVYLHTFFFFFRDSYKLIIWSFLSPLCHWHHRETSNHKCYRRQEYMVAESQYQEWSRISLCDNYSGFTAGRVPLVIFHFWNYTLHLLFV